MFALLRNQKVRKFFASLHPESDDFSPYKIMLWVFVAWCIFFHILIVRAALVCYFTGAHEVPLWPW